MIKTLLHFATRRFERAFSYDAGYMHTIIDGSASAGLRLGAMPLISQFRGPRHAVGVWAGASLASTLDGDCGACAQLILDQAVAAGVPSSELEKCTRGEARTDFDSGLGFLFAQAAIAGDMQVDDLRSEIVARHGERAAIAASFAAASGRFFPVLKRATGAQMSCQGLRFEASKDKKAIA